MTTLSEHVTLRDRTKVPRLAFGTAFETSDLSCEDQVYRALKAGFRHIDTAEIYKYGDDQCLPSVGRAIKRWTQEDGHSRKDIFVTTKWGLGDAVSSNPASSLAEQLRLMDLEYVDLYLHHDPDSELSLSEAWAEMEGLKKEGKCRSIGVSNYQAHHLKQISETWNEAPVVNQIEHHPYCAHSEQDQAWNQAASNFDIRTMPFTSLASLRLHTNEQFDAVVKQISKAKGIADEQVLLSWAMQTSKGPVAMYSNSPGRLEKYLAVCSPDFEPLTETELDEITQAGKQVSYRRW